MSIAQFVTDKKTAIKILKAIRKNMPADQHGDYFICNLLKTHGRKIDTVTVSEILEYIKVCINTPRNTLGCWLNEKHPEFYESTYHPIGYRKAWIDVMIKQLKEAL